MEKLEIGKINSKFSNVGEGISCKFEESGFNVVATFRGATADEIENIQSGKIQLAMLVKNGVFMMLIKFGSMEWMDMPILINAEPNETTSEDQGYAMQIVLAEVPKGEVKALRLVGLDSNFSKQFHKLNKLVTKKSKAEITSEVFKIQRAYTTKELLKMCVYKCSI